MKGKAEGAKRCKSFSENLKETLWPPELPLPGGRQVRSRLHSGAACSMRCHPPLPVLSLAPFAHGSQKHASKVGPMEKNPHRWTRRLYQSSRLSQPSTRPSRFEQTLIPTMKSRPKGPTRPHCCWSAFSLKLRTEDTTSTLYCPPLKYILMVPGELGGPRRKTL